MSDSAHDRRADVLLALSEALSGGLGGMALLGARPESIAMAREAVQLLFRAQQVERFGKVPAVAESLAAIREAIGPETGAKLTDQWRKCGGCARYVARCECP